MTISFRYGSTVLLAVSLVSMLTCARDQQLTSIDIVPSAETFLAPDPFASINLRALGNYIHPPVQKDITSQVTWASNTPDLVTVTNAGVLSPTGITACGGALVSATLQTNTAGNRSSQGAIVTGYMTATVNNVSVAGCPGFTGGNLPVLTVTISGQGTVTSSPPGFTCTTANQQCSLAFATGTSLTLIATPSVGSTFVSWAGCDTVQNVNQCNVILNNNKSLVVTFNP
jgi:hypothetical protein